jgi:hypothetical protein
MPKKATVVLFMALSWNLSEGTHKNHKNPQSGYWPNFERDTLKYKEVAGNAIWASLPGAQSRKSVRLSWKQLHVLHIKRNLEHGRIYRVTYYRKQQKCMWT